jgi:hypothetical protein
MTLEIVRVRPVPGRLILMPDRGYQPVPAEGARVHKDAFYTRAINQGDLEELPDTTASTSVLAATPLPAAPSFVPASSIT